MARDYVWCKECRILLGADAFRVHELACPMTRRRRLHAKADRVMRLLRRGLPDG